MKRHQKFLVGLAALAMGAGLAHAQDATFGTDTDADYAARLWAAMEEMNLAGDGMLRSFPYEGVAPHGMMLETFYTTASVDDHSGDLVIQRNYGPAGVSADEVLSHPAKHLAEGPGRLRRAAGFEPEPSDSIRV